MKFYCQKHPKKTDEHSSYSSIINKDGIMVYRYSKLHKPIVCPNKKCGRPMVPDVDPKDIDFSSVSIGKYSSLSADGKREHLKKRAKDFNKLAKNMDYKRHLDTEHL